MSSSNQNFFRLFFVIVILIVGGLTIASNLDVGSGSPTPTPTLYNPFTAGSAVLQTELIPVIESITLSNNNCRLPCLWDLEPEESTATDIAEFVRTVFRQEPYLGTQDNGLSYYAGFLNFEEGSMNFVFRVEDNILKRTEIRLNTSSEWLDDNPFLLSQLIEDYGQPTNIYMRYNPSQPLNYSLAIVYNDQGILAEYTFAPTSENIIDDSYINICSQDHEDGLIKIWLQSADSDDPVMNNLLPIPEDISVTGPYLDIQEMADVNVEEFTEVFSNNGSNCIQVFSLRTLREQGYE